MEDLFEQPHPSQPHLMLIPKDGIPCREGLWTPCRHGTKRNTTVEEKEKCNLYECPYHYFI